MNETELVEAETPVDEAPAPVEPEGPLVVQIGDETPEDEIDEEEVAKAPAWVQDLRKRDREREREKRELQKRVKELEAANTVTQDKPKLGAKPSLADFDYDEDAHGAALDKWYADKATFEAEESKAQQQERQAQQSWEAKVSSYNEAKIKLPVDDFAEAEALIQDTFDATQQALLIKVAKDAPTLVYALGKNPKKANDLAAIKDYTEFVAEAVRLEMSVKTTRKPATSPERAVSVPAAGGGVSTDNTLDRLRDEAAKTGDYSKVLAYKKSKQ